MSSLTTRLELIIIAAALLVLFLCRQPPKSGNAGVRVEIGRTAETGQRANDEPTTASDAAASDQESVAMPDNTSPESAVPPQPKTKQIAVVDARRCNGLKYKDLMYGEVTIQWVWEGGKRVPKKVCQVREPSGIISTWSFDNNDGIVISELPQP
jgi:hypothetical protein